MNEHARAREHLRELWLGMRNDASVRADNRAQAVIDAFKIVGLITPDEAKLWTHSIQTCPGHEDEGGRVWCAYCGNMAADETDEPYVDSTHEEVVEHAKKRAEAVAKWPDWKLRDLEFFDGGATLRKCAGYPVEVLASTLSDGLCADCVELVDNWGKDLEKPVGQACHDHRPDGPDPLPDCKCIEIDREVASRTLGLAAKRPLTRKR